MELTGILRKAGNRGAFYPQSCAEVENSFGHFSDMINRVTNPKLLKVSPRAIIVPHAGYIYSGFTANAAHKTLANAHPKRVVVIGPSHHVYFEGISAAFTQKYETPCGDIETDLPFLEKLHDEFQFQNAKIAHQREHSTETQIPFIKHYLPEAKIIELVYGKTHWQQVAAVAEYTLADTETALVISSDLSHFYTKREAEMLDAVCLNAIKHADPELFDQGCEACGIIGIKALVHVVNKLKLKTGILDYRTSADVSNDTNSVVGYAAAVVW